MTEREIRIIQAAIQVFFRYGIQRTTMNDIANHAGVARQTLYNAFAKKEDVLRACMRWHCAQAVAKIEQDLADQTDLAAQLALVFRVISLEVYDLLATSNHAEDIVEGMFQAGKSELDQATKNYQKILSDILSPHHAHLAQSGLTVQAMADFCSMTALSAKRGATSRAHLIELLNALTQLVVCAAGAPK